MRRLVALAVAGLLALVVTVPAGAAPPDGQLNFRAAPLSGANEVPANDSQGAGVALFKLNRAETALDFKLIVANLDNVLQAHIHCGPADANGGVTAFLYGGPLVITQNGPLSSGVITNVDVIPLPDSPACPGGISDFEDLVEHMRAGNTYVNVHTVALPGGEIRGQIR